MSQDAAVRLRLTLFYAALLGGTSAVLLGASWLALRGHLAGTLDPVAESRALGALGTQYAIGIAAVVLLALGGGYLVAGQVLAPAERAAAAQRRFVANASHELRTPMTAIRVDAEVALDDPNVTAEELRAVLLRTVEATEQTDALMASLLTLSSAAEGRLERVPLRLDDVVRRALPADRRVHAELAPGTVVGDPVLLERAVANLVDNALRHGRLGGQVDVRLRDGTLTVANPGKPIAPEDLARLAEPFERLRRDHGGGTGLGLSIVAAIARAHGGRLELSSPPAGGLVARVVLAPATASASAQPSSAASTNRAGSARNARVRRTASSAS